MARFREGHPLPRGVRLGDVARAVDDGVEAGLREERGLGPEVDRLALGQAQLGGERGGAGEAAGRGEGRRDEAGRPRHPRGVRRQRPQGGEERVGLLVGPGAYAVAELGARRDHVGLGAARHQAQVEADAVEPLVALLLLGLGEGERARRPAHRLVEGAVLEGPRRGGVPAHPLEGPVAGGDAAVLQHGAGARGLGHHHPLEAVPAGEEGAHAAARPRLLVGGEEERHVAVERRAQHGLDEAGGGALDVAGAEADGAITLDAEAQGVALPPRVGGHRVEVDVEEDPRRAPRAEEADAAIAELLDLAREAGAQRPDQVGEDPLAIDDPRRVPRVERDQQLEPREGPGERVHVRA